MFNWVLITLLYQCIATYELETERLIELQLTRGNICLKEWQGKLIWVGDPNNLFDEILLKKRSTE